MNDSNPYDLTRDHQGNPIPKDEGPLAQPPQRIGRYRIERVLGKGGFGLVYLAQDEQLNRPVAVKVPHAKLISKPQDAEAYLAEARTVANLDHPGIVPVHDVGSTEDCPCYVVSKYIQGTDLATKLKQQRLKYREAAELVATVADALHYAHKQGLVHRDVKPGNILIDKSGKPYVVDFGLALREENIGKGPKYAGTFAYMSPEQARGEGHRVDGRSDIFSLGVVLYELLAGRQPFRGDTQAELLEQVTSYEARPLRQYDEKLPKELERICHKAMSKRASDRYSSAHDMAEDLRHFLAEQTVIQSGTSPGGVASIASETHASQVASTSVGLIAASSASMSLGTSDNQPIKIVPKGLRSFDSHDADFFLELLPGPRDREGLPDSLRFWKTRIEETDPDNTFTVGLIYGPSGCGKSSLVKAGLLPRLSEDVIPVYIEATPEETETRLLHGLRKRCPALEDNLSLKATLAALRRGQGIPVGKKVLIVLDQFEQWLHAKKEEENSDLVQALRQCDGGRVQCIVMVRDDFWLAVSRFLRELEVRLLEGQNIALADLFDLDHAHKVLAAFGRAFGKLPEQISETTNDQKQFLKQSVAGLAEEGKVVCVRLALFAEMMKGKAWTPATLKEVGGTKGVGVTFLEETFSSSTASPEYRYHQKGARAVLKDLLPDSGTDIKGYMRSYAELVAASGYGGRPKDFDDLVRILDSEIRLITPTDPEGKASDNESVTQTEAGQKYFQLTHDYLVHSLRDWLTRKQKETRRGRAELRLFDLSVTWNSKPENRFLPSWWENLNTRFFTDQKKWTEPQRKMMGKAGRVHGIRTSLVALLLVAMTFAGVSIRSGVLEQRSQTQAQIQKKENVTRAEGLVASLLSADIAQVPAIVSDLKTYREWADPLLREENDKAADKSRQKLHASLALLPIDATQVDYLYGRLLDGEPHEVPVILDALAPHKDSLRDKLWAVVEKPEKGKESQRLRAASALAKYDSESEKWAKVSGSVVEQLVAENPVFLGLWMEGFRPVKGKLLESLRGAYQNPNVRESERSLATNILADYASNQPQVLADLLMDADDKQFAVIFLKFKEHGELGLAVLTSEIDKKLPAELPSSDEGREKLAKRQANAAVALLKMNLPEQVWPLLRHSPDPRVRSYLIHRLGVLRADAAAIVKRLNDEPDVTIRRALLLSLGEFGETEFTPDDRTALLPKLQETYRTASDPGLHAASEWLLRRWGVTLPELSVGEPTLSEEQKQRMAKLTTEVADIRQRMVTSELELPARQAAWERQLREQPAALPASLSEGLMTHYPFDETAGTETANAVTGQPGGIYAGLGKPEWGPGILGHAVRLNGEGGHFICGEAFQPERTDSFSYGCWFLSQNEGRFATLLAKMTDSDKGWQGFDLFLQVNRRLCTHLIHNWQDNALLVFSTDPVPDGHWKHVLMTYDGTSSATGVTLYVDGRIVRTRTDVDKLSGTIQNNVPLHIGLRNTAHPFRGQIDDLRIYNRRLSAEEVRQLYEAGLRAVAGVPVETRNTEQQAFLAATYLPQDEPLSRLQRQLAAIEAALRVVRWDGSRRWYVDTQGHTMVVIPGPVEFVMGSPTTEVGRIGSEYQHKRRIGRTFAIAAKSVTVEQYRQFEKDYSLPAEYTRLSNLPVVLIDWYRGAKYCNWLSEHEGLPADQWCYEIEGNEIKPKANYLSLSGYRHPTEAEMEYATRAGAVTSRYFGETDELLSKYAWNQKNSQEMTWPVGSLKPSDLGLFDVQGNVFTWCQESFKEYPQQAEVAEDQEDSLEILSVARRVLRGGSILGSPLNLRSANRFVNLPDYMYYNIGCRVARTLSSVAITPNPPNL